ncbi:Stk1 family PASTA domain-containing Ser/Thr kinase [Rarobacter incanus]|uniref:non-specific serine/threonine protein kinase n=1 Tax=Rarobacter incanus TaxID=153494 RepID=A0A542SPZ5_9MICO|nr:Stk1 family PASTA domain-containing Ser/Thr kinase [Rarobacter incanus]TQK76645.1 serine/threonine-protein kinase [Rarobacter incanus]
MVDHAPRILANRYEVGALIGRGGMAEVHIGHDNRLGRTVAIKILRSDLARDPSFQARFRREAQAAAALNHPAIVAVYDTGEDNVVDPATGTVSHVPFIVMEYVEGHTVRDILRDGNAVPIEEAVEITIGVLSALDYSHRAGIVHRDIKPANVMLTPTGSVKVMDFGIARALADSAATMTQTQAVIGTAQYLSPEQARGEQVDARSDLYSTGCLLFELLTGRPPFTGDSPVSVAYQHVRENAPTPSSIASDVPPVLDRIVAKALAKDREQRYSSAAAFRSDLEAAMKGLPVSANEPVEAATQVFAAPLPAPVPAAAAAPAWQTTPTATITGPTATGSLASVEEPEDPEHKSSKGLMWTLISIGIVALIAIIAILVMVSNKKSDTPQVVTQPFPNVVEMDVNDAKLELTRKGFTAEPTITEVSDEDAEEGTVLASDPVANASVALDTAITLTVSSGSADATIPDVTGLDQDRAREMLSDQGLNPVTGSSEYSPDVDRDKVTRSDPAAGESVAKGSDVTIYYSNGQVLVPNVVGAKQAAAEEKLNEQKLVVTVETVEDDSQKAGTVISQTLPADQPVAQRSAITITVAKAVSKVAIPDVSGMTEGAAMDALKAQGLEYNATSVQASSDTVPSGQVISTSPKIGKKVKKGTVVTLTISTGPANNQQPSDPGDTDAGDGSGTDTGSDTNAG